MVTDIRQGSSETRRGRRSNRPVAPRCAFVIFGVSGDLSARKLLPALYALHQQGLLHPESIVVGYGRSDWDDATLRQQGEQALHEHAAEFAPEGWKTFAPRLRYVRGDYGGTEGAQRLRALLEELDQSNRIYYTATPPSTYVPLVEALGEAGLQSATGGWTRLVVEKPFGHDLASAVELNRVIARHFDENQVYRIDHYLAKETTQNLAVLRFANTVFEPLWSNRYIDHVQISMTESVGIEGRGDFYEQSGVIRDVFQNHLLQLCALVAMEPPARFDATSVRNEKVKVFEAMSCVRPEDVVLGQYVAGGGMRGYRDETGVAEDSRQATYAAARFEIRNWRWAGVPFFVRSGKRLEGKATEIILRMKTPPHIPFALPEEEAPADRLVLKLAPDEGMALRFNTKVPGQGITLERANLDFSYSRHFERPNPDAYETLLLDAMVGDATLFMRSDEIEAQWRIVAPLLFEQDSGRREPFPYPAGTLGPPQADGLLEQLGRHWHRPGYG